MKLRESLYSSDFSLIIIGIFYPTGEPISPQMLRCGPFAVGLPQLHGPHLASAAISTRKSSRLPELFIKTADTFLSLTKQALNC
jgi:hypothetical protein